ncbi:MAG: hypothetical protein ACFFD4_26750 [Candidatus Odinarchaeota archaeon]
MAFIKLKVVGDVSESFLAGLPERFLEVVSVNKTHGPFDVVLKLEASTEKELKRKVKLVAREFKLIRPKEIFITA